MSPVPVAITTPAVQEAIEEIQKPVKPTPTSTYLDTSTNGTTTTTRLNHVHPLDPLTPGEVSTTGKSASLPRMP